MKFILNIFWYLHFYFLLILFFLNDMQFIFYFKGTVWCILTNIYNCVTNTQSSSCVDNFHSSRRFPCTLVRQFPTINRADQHDDCYHHFCDLFIFFTEQCFVPSYCQVAYCWMNIPLSVYPFPCWGTLGFSNLGLSCYFVLTNILNYVFT